MRFIGGGKEGMSALAISGNLGKRFICIDAAKARPRGAISS